MSNMNHVINKLISFKNTLIIEDVEKRTGKRFKSTQQPKQSLHSSYPVAFTHTPRRSPLPQPFPGQYLVIVALGDLRTGNGLPQDLDVAAISSGEWVVIDGSKDMSFGGTGGGMAVFIVLDLVEPKSEAKSIEGRG